MNILFYVMNMKTICHEHTYIVIHEYEPKIRGYKYKFPEINTILMNINKNLVGEF